MNSWIPCEKEMPSNGEFILVSRNDGNVDIMIQDETGRMAKSGRYVLLCKRNDSCMNLPCLNRINIYINTLRTTTPHKSRWFCG